MSFFKNCCDILLYFELDGETIFGESVGFGVSNNFLESEHYLKYFFLLILFKRLVGFSNLLYSEKYPKVNQ